MVGTIINFDKVYLGFSIFLLRLYFIITDYKGLQEPNEIV